jgi:hypothetical protein
MNTTAGISGGTAFGNQGIPTTGNVGGSLNWSDSPTITITPRQGTEILGALTSRMSVNTLGKMANAGYRFDFLLALTAEGLASVRGPQTGVGTDFRPGDPEYLQLIESIGRLIDRGQLMSGPSAGTIPTATSATVAKRSRSKTSLLQSPSAAALADSAATTAESPITSPTKTIIRPCGLIRMREHGATASA